MNTNRAQRGISLIEAVVALAVMAFGMLAYAGLQSTLRGNSDIAKQRAQAVRIAQEEVEKWRAFTSLETFAEIVDMPAEPLPDIAFNTTFNLSRQVVDPDGFAMKTLVVDVTWADRNNEVQSVRLSTTIAGIAPALGATLSVPPSGNPNLVRARHPAIPMGAVQEGVSSRFRPPQPSGGEVSWVFDNITGVITSICVTTTDCTAVNAFLLAGFVRFAIGEMKPTAADSETPPGPRPLVPIGVEITPTFPLPAGTLGCYLEQRFADTPYFCVVLVDPADTPPRWSGRSNVVGLPWATDRADADPLKYRVCRYTTQRTDDELPNREHPLDYADVVGPLTNQNFLVIRAGFADVEFDCPDDEPSTPLINGRTWHHQPAT